MPQPSVFVVRDNDDAHQNGEVLIERKFKRYTMFWSMSEEDLEALHTAVGKYIAGERG